MRVQNKLINKLYIIMASVLSLSLIMSNVVLAEEGKLSPFTEHIIPCTIDAADFDYGGLNTAYNVNGTINGKYVYREDAQMNFYTSNGVVVGFNVGDWMKYTVQVSNSSEYVVNACYATPNSNSNIEITCDGETILSTVMPSTGDDWSTYKTKKIGKVTLSSGKHVLRVKLLAGGCTLKSISFTPYTANNDIDYSRKTGEYRNYYIPTRIEAEDFDMLGNAKKSEDEDDYRDDEGIKIQNKTDDTPYILLAQNQIVNYTFNSEKDDAYEIKISSKGTGNLYIDDCENAIELESDDLAEAKKVIVLWIPKGKHKIKIKANSGMSIDYIDVLSSTDDYYKIDDLKDINSTDEEVTEKVYKDIYVSTNGNDNGDGSKTSPFKTIERAKKYIRTISDDMNGNIIVHILSGEYHINNKIEFNESDSGKNGFFVIYKGENKLDKPVINGGTEINGWTKYNEYIWCADAKNVEDTRTLYINGLQAQRARSKYLYYAEDYADSEETTYGEDGIVVSQKNFPKNIKNSENLELVWDLYWTDQHTPVKSMEMKDSNVIMWMEQPWFHYARTKSYDGTSPSKDKTFYIENAFELLDEPGEFYFDKTNKKIYYYPFLNENMETADTWVGTTEFLMDVKGSSIENKIKNIKFDNIDFKYGAWNGASDEGVVCVQADKNYKTEGETVSRGGKIVPAQITVEYAEGVSITNCNFSCLGSAGISMENAVSKSEIVGNKFTDISGSAIIVGSWDHINTLQAGQERCTKINVTDNVIRRAAEEFKGGCGISVYYVNSVNVDHNDIKNVPYSGITTGWGWGEDIIDVGNNSISYNRIEDVTSSVHDGAHIYNLGPQRNSVMNGNYLIKAGDHRGGIYFDQGSGQFTAEDNVIKDTTLWLFASNAAIKNINVSNTYTDTADMSIDANNVTVKNTTVVENDKWPDKAVQIMNNAGVRDKYKKLLNNVEYPSWRTNFIYVIPTEVFKGKSNDGTIEAEDYIKGGEGVGYHKESGTAVKTFTTVGGLPGNLVIGSTSPNDWLKYEFTINKSAEYDIMLKTANAFSTTDPVPQANVYLDDVKIVSEYDIPNNGSWNEHIWNTVTNCEISEGTHILKIEFVNNGFSFDAMKIYNKDLLLDVENDAEYDEGEFVTEAELKEDLFNDIAGHWAEDTIINLAKQNIIKGIGNNLFAPENDVTLGQAITLLFRCSGLEISDDTIKENAVKYGLANETENYNSPIMRQRLADIMMKLYSKQIGKYSLVWDEGAYKDFDQIDVQYRNAVLGSKELGLLQGNTDNEFLPNKTLTRAEAAVVVGRFMKLH